MKETMQKLFLDNKEILMHHQFPEPIKTYISEIGMDDFIKMVCRFGGKNIYIPKPCMLENIILEHHIKQEYNGKNIKELSDRYSISRPTVYAYLKK